MCPLPGGGGTGRGFRAALPVPSAFALTHVGLWLPQGDKARARRRLSTAFAADKHPDPTPDSRPALGGRRNRGRFDELSGRHRPGRAAAGRGGRCRFSSAPGSRRTRPDVRSDRSPQRDRDDGRSARQHLRQHIRSKTWCSPRPPRGATPEGIVTPPQRGARCGRRLSPSPQTPGADRPPQGRHSTRRSDAVEHPVDQLGGRTGVSRGIGEGVPVHRHGSRATQRVPQALARG